MGRPFASAEGLILLQISDQLKENVARPRGAGPDPQPHDPAHTPGGSSHGSAAGVAAGFFPLALGTQTIGSIIRPAAFCGVAGFVATYDRIRTDGTLHVSRSLDRVGLFAMNGEFAREDAALFERYRDRYRPQTSGGSSMARVSRTPSSTPTAAPPWSGGSGWSRSAAPPGSTSG